MNDYVDITLLKGKGDANSFTISAWANPSVSDGTQDGLICINQDFGTFMRHTSETLTFWVNAATVTSGISVDEWAFWTGTYDGTTMRLFKDGVLAGSAAATAPDLSGSNLYRIADGNGNELWNGLIDDVRIYGRVLSAAEVSD